MASNGVAYDPTLSVGEAFPQFAAGKLDLLNRSLYWTDRGDAPRGNTVNRAPIDTPPGTPEVLVRHLMEGIGLALDVAGKRIFVTDLGGSLYTCDLDGRNERAILNVQGNLTGVAYAHVEMEQ